MKLRKKIDNSENLSFLIFDKSNNEYIFFIVCYKMYWLIAKNRTKTDYLGLLFLRKFKNLSFQVEQICLFWDCAVGSRNPLVDFHSLNSTQESHRRIPKRRSSSRQQSCFFRPRSRASHHNRPIRGSARRTHTRFFDIASRFLQRRRRIPARLRHQSSG